MALQVDISRDNIQAALRSFLMVVLDPAIEVFIAQDNRVPEPKGLDFVVMSWLYRQRLSVNIDEQADVKFQASILGNVLTVESIAFGAILKGSALFGVGVLAGTRIGDQISGTPGGSGDYNINLAQTLASQVMASGEMTMEQHTHLIFQLDIHGPQSGDNCQIISTAFNDGYAAEQFAGSGLGIVPLYTNDGKQAPFQNAEQQWESRWVLEAHMQANIKVRVPQQYADDVEVEVIEVETAYPTI
jgi:hypothetical protein